MRFQHEFISIPGANTPIRAYLARPLGVKESPGLLFYSDIFQLTPSTLRMAARFAGYGFTVLAPEIYSQHVTAGTAWAFDDQGRENGLAAAKATTIAEFDDDARRCIEMLSECESVQREQLGVVGFCLGGHLAFRAALSPAISAAVCYYPTGLATGALAQDQDAGSLQQATSRDMGRLHLIFGADDPHVPTADRAKIVESLQQNQRDFTVSLYAAEHAFMRDEGPRYDPEITDVAFAAGITTLRRS